MAVRSSTFRGARARAWCRADLAGGTLDIWPLGLLHPRARTINLALDLAVEVEMVRIGSGYRVLQGESVVAAASATDLAATGDGALIGLVVSELSLPPVEIKVSSDSPRGGGLGASSALTVALIAASESLLGIDQSPPEARAALARDLEARLMGLPTGRQDHFAALLGGVLEIRHEAGGERVQRLEVDLQEIADSLVVAYTGESHFSAGNNWRIIRRRLEAEPETIRCFDGIRDSAEEMAASLREGRIERAGELMSVEWSWRRRLAEGISTASIEHLLGVAAAEGAWGGKVCGAGGGGCLVLLAHAERRQDVAKALAENGATILQTAPIDEPLQVVLLASDLEEA